MAGRGRPCGFTKEIGDEICTRLMDGESLRRICLDDHMPARSSVFLWLHHVVDKDFSDQYERARAVMAECLVEDLLDIADNSTNDFMEREGVEVPDHENIQRAKLRVDTRKWFVGKVLPKKYGDSMNLKHSGNLPVLRISMTSKKPGPDAADS